MLPTEGMARTRHARLPISGLGVLLLVAAALAASGTRAGAPEISQEISRQQAIEIARQEPVRFGVQTIEAEKSVEGGRSVWRITFHGEPIGPSHPIGELMFVLIDRTTGEITSLGMT